MDYIVDNETLNLIQNTIEEYRMFSYKEKLVLALSGGKDSLFTMICLKQLGYDILPVIIDMGYEENWHFKIQTLSKNYGLEATVINVRGQDFQKLLNKSSRLEIKKSLDFLDNIEKKDGLNITPCTQCYNTKITALTTFSSKVEANTIIFGHHGTDAIVSFLKSALMYIDRFDKKHEIFTKGNFKNLLEEIKSSLSENHDDFLSKEIAKRFLDLANMGVASTDEPPVQFLDTSTQSFKISRPLFNLLEEVIIDYRNRFQLATEGSGCGHSLMTETQTPRELIHYGIVAKMQSASSIDTKKWLLELVKSGLLVDGTLKINARKERENILGVGYKMNWGCGNKL